nr:MAG TPA: Heat shock protein HSP 90-alpha PROTEIN, ATP BINDING, CHAPERONE [Caudoviricetes sp.]
MFPDLTWEDEPIEVELRPAMTDIDIKAQEYANKVTDNEVIKELIINAFKAGYEI